MPGALRVIVNRSGGTANAIGDRLPQQLRDAFAEAGAEIDLQLVEGSEVADAVRGADGRVVVGGGDGTLAAAAQQLAGAAVEMAVLPLGTRNHLARDLGISMNLIEAAALAVHGQAAAIDVGEVNGRVFVNNASIGLYPLMVRVRDVYRRRGWPKWLASIPAAAITWGRLPERHLRIETDNDRRAVETPLLFVGNNRYSLERGTVGSRGSLRDGRLSVYAVAPRSRAGLSWFAFRTLLGRAERKLDFVELGDTAALTVRGETGAIEIALDGEVQRMDSPLEFRIRPGALKLVRPEGRA